MSPRETAKAYRRYWLVAVALSAMSTSACIALLAFGWIVVGVCAGGTAVAFARMSVCARHRWAELHQLERYRTRLRTEAER